MLILFSSKMSSTEPYDANAENARFIRSLSATDGIFESPIDLDISYMKVIELNPLHWVNIDVAPRKLKITNTGYTVILSANWQEERPYLSGGPLEGNYVFSQIHFHWGEDEMRGSEHSADGASMPMELHAVHFKSDYDSLEAALRRADGVTVLVYFFKLQDQPNQFMEEIVKNLDDIRTTDSSARIVPSNITNLVKPFDQDYFLYWGSITAFQHVHNILWIISRYPIGISSQQIAEFRTLKDANGMPLLSNIRPLKEAHERSVFYVCPSGLTYASLLPIPRDFSSKEKMETSQTTNTVPTETE